MRKLKILIVTYHPWRENISVGNTLDNIFTGLEDKLEFANIYIRDDQPSSRLVSRFFHISEKELAKSIFSRKSVGKEFVDTRKVYAEHFPSWYNVARRKRWDLMLLVQDLIGVMGCWQSEALDKFVDKFDPDLIFGPLGRMPVSNNIMTYISKKKCVPLITYPWDDHYSLHKRSWSPLFWLRLFIEREAIRKCAKQSEFLYCISSLMQKEYNQYFSKKCKLLYKGYDFLKKPNIKKADKIIKIIYMGNIGAGRWKLLAKVVKAINEINTNGTKIQMNIFTLSPKSKRMSKLLNIGESHLMEPVPESAKMSTLAEADVLLHVEPIATKERLMYRLSFSTKIVDYLYCAKCILAIGGNTASMQYLIENNAGIVENNANNIKKRLMDLTQNQSLITEWAERAWECGVKNHKIDSIQETVYNDFRRIVNEYTNK